MFIETGVNELNTLYRSTGLTKGQVYRVINSGNLEPNALTVKFGDFVKWDGSKWVITAAKLATTAEVSATIYTNAGRFIKAEGATGGTFYPDDDPNNYHLGSIVLLDNVLVKLTSEARQDDEGKYYFTYNTTDLINIVMVLEDRIHTLEAAND